LIRALALSMSIAIDPEHSGPDSDAPLAFFPSKSSDQPPADEGVEERGPSSDDTNAPLVLRFGVGGQVALGVAPAPAAGLVITGSPRYRDFSVALEFRTDAVASRALASGVSIESHIVTGNLVPCFHFGPGLACGIGTLGVVQATSDQSSAEEDSAIYAALGIRVGPEWPLAKPLLLRTHADLLGNLTRAHIELDGQNVWEMPALAGSLGISLLASFP
jgi:hypothetical protein